MSPSVYHIIWGQKNLDLQINAFIHVFVETLLKTKKKKKSMSLESEPIKCANNGPMRGHDVEAELHCTVLARRCFVTSIVPRPRRAEVHPEPPEKQRSWETQWAAKTGSTGRPELGGTPHGPALSLCRILFHGEVSEPPTHPTGGTAS